jgi:NADH:ubiquinone oxidoreductase subunit
MNTVKTGTLVGVDKYGNKYFQNDRYFYGKNRWVEYNEKVGFDFDPSQVPAEWHNWLHYMVDDNPNTKPRVHHHWQIDHVENATGSQYQYTPYSTTRTKINSWQPPNSQVRIGPSK